MRGWYLGRVLRPTVHVPSSQYRCARGIEWEQAQRTWVQSRCAATPADRICATSVNLRDVHAQVEQGTVGHRLVGIRARVIGGDLV